MSHTVKISLILWFITFSYTIIFNKNFKVIEKFFEKKYERHPVVKTQNGYFLTSHVDKISDITSQELKSDNHTDLNFKKNDDMYINMRFDNDNTLATTLDKPLNIRQDKIDVDKIKVSKNGLVYIDKVSGIDILTADKSSVMKIDDINGVGIKDNVHFGSYMNPEFGAPMH